MKGIFIALQVMFITSIIGLAISYFSTIIDLIPDINFLEAVGVYALYMPLHHALTLAVNKQEE
jgi:hypothetical protein